MAENGVVPSKKIKDSKVQEEILKSLTGISNPDEKFSALLKRAIETEKINKTLLASQKQNQRLYESLTADYNQTKDIKSKLESLCRELQRQNKSIKEESLARIKDEEEKRKETQTKFQKSLNEIQKMMNENTEKNNKLKEDNTEMSVKFRHILEQYELREQQMNKITKQMDLVTQLNDAKLAKMQVELAAEREKFSKETAIYEDTIKILKQQLAESRTAERLLKEQVELYSGKYGEFQESLKKSHDVFEGYKTDMTKMSKKNIKMEKEVHMWKTKFEKTNSVCLTLASEKGVRDQHITTQAKQMFHLQKLCRQLQFERTAFLNALKENNLEIPVVPEAPKDTKIDLPVEPPTEAQPPVLDNKLDLMTKDCDELKKNLAQLQGKLETLASVECEETAAAASSAKTSNKKEKHRNRKGKKDKLKSSENSEETAEKTNGIQNGTGNPTESAPLGETKNCVKTPEIVENSGPKTCAETTENGTEIVEKATDSAPLDESKPKTCPEITDNGTVEDKTPISEKVVENPPENQEKLPSNPASPEKVQASPLKTEISSESSPQQTNNENIDQVK